MKSARKVTNWISFFLKTTVLATVLLLHLTCSSESEKPDDTSPDGYDVTATLEFSSGKTMALKAHSVTPSYGSPFVEEEGKDILVWTPAYQMVEEGLQYRLSIKAAVKNRPGSYTLYTDEDDYLEVAGWSVELTVKSKDGSTDELYRSQYQEDESGVLDITSLTADRLKGTFSADVPKMPQDGEWLKIKDGKINVKIQRINP